MKTTILRFVFLNLLVTSLLSTLLISCEQNVLEIPSDEVQLTQIENRIFSPGFIGMWFHSHEENTNPMVENVYRPYEFDFPPSRNRTGLRFSNSGNFAYLYYGPADQLMQRSGKWLDMGSQIQILFDSSPDDSQFPNQSIITIVSAGTDRLVIEPLDWD